MLLQLLHLAQAALAAYGALQSYAAITNLQKYESTAQKLAQWSTTTATELHKTRTTQTAGAAALLFSLLASLYLSFRGASLGFIARWLASPAMAGGVWFALRHMRAYWTQGGKTEGVRVPAVVPNVEEYREAQGRTEEVLRVLEFLMFGWGVTSVVAVIGGY